ncbi:ion transporter [Flindersiella endophytica]
MTSRERARRLVEAPRFQHAITVVILLNAVTLGAETSHSVMARAGGALHVIDKVALTIFVVELLLKLYAYRLSFFRDAWNWFDFLIIGISLLPSTGGLSVLRAFRVLRVLRLISVVPSMRRVVNALLSAIPGMASIVGLLSMVMYVAAVMSTKLFGGTAPEYFGDLGTSLWTLFQVMTGEAWPEIAQQVMAEHPTAWLFFLLYILVSTFVVLNLFLAVMVSAMEGTRHDEEAAHQQERQQDKATDAVVLDELAALRAEIRALREETQAEGTRSGGGGPT